MSREQLVGIGASHGLLVAGAGDASARREVKGTTVAVCGVADASDGAMRRKCSAWAWACAYGQVMAADVLWGWEGSVTVLIAEKERRESGVRMGRR